MHRLSSALALVALAGLAAPARSQEAPDCDSVKAEKVQLEAKKIELRKAVTELAFGGRKKRRKVTPGQVGGAIAGTAASVLLPFGIGAVLSAGVGAATRGRPARPDPAAEAANDPMAIIAQQRAVDARLEEIAAGPCAAAQPAG